MFAEPLLALDDPGLREPRLVVTVSVFIAAIPGRLKESELKVQQHRVLSGRDDLVPTEVSESAMVTCITTPNK